MDARLIAMGVAGLAGLVAGGALWALSGGQAQGEALDALDTRFAAISTRARGRPDRPSDALAQILATPLFAAPDSSAQNQTDLVVQVYGLAKSPVRTAALLSVGGGAAEWFSVGETRDGVTLRAVSGSGASIATAFGERELLLGAPTVSGPVASDVPPPGLKSPPPPASAPAMSQ